MKYLGFKMRKLTNVIRFKSLSTMVLQFHYVKDFVLMSKTSVISIGGF